MTTVEARYDEESASYVLGFEQDGAFIPTSSVPESTVKTHIEAAKNAQANETASSA